MNMRDVKVGLRLGVGFALILLSASILLIGALASNSASRSTLQATLQRASDQQDVAQEMRTALLSSAVSVRNMGLQTTVENVQKDEAEAKKQRSMYLQAKAKLEASGLSDQEREILSHLAGIDIQMDTQFKEAVDLSLIHISEPTRPY